MRRHCLFGTASIHDPESTAFAKMAAASAAVSVATVLPDYAGVPIEELCRIESVLRMFSDYKVSLATQARCLGQDASMIETVADLREVVHTLAIDRKSRKIWERLECFEMIGAGLTKRFGPDISGQMLWMSREPIGKARKYRNVLETGTLPELKEFAMQLRPIYG